MTKAEFRRAVERYRRFTKIVKLARKVERKMREALMLASGWTTDIEPKSVVWWNPAHDRSYRMFNDAWLVASHSILKEPSAKAPSTIAGIEAALRKMLS